jgi:hypothetical protein
MSCRFHLTAMSVIPCARARVTCAYLKIIRHSKQTLWLQQTGQSEDPCRKTVYLLYVKNGVSDKRSAHARARAHTHTLSLSSLLSLSIYQLITLSFKKTARSAIAISIKHYTVPAKAGQLPKHQLEILHQARLPEKKEIRDYKNWPSTLQETGTG